MQDIVQAYLMYFLVPLWLAAGIADWLCHRIARIELSSGWRESVFHLAMLVEMGIPSVAALFFEINALVFLVALAAWVLHELTALWDVSYAQSLRRISPFEQHVHSFLEMIPLLALSCMMFLHWDQFLALFGLGTAERDMALRWKAEPLPAAYTISAVVAVGVLQVVPYLEELWRGVCAERVRIAAHRSNTRARQQF
jgi:hypothetical protein